MKCRFCENELRHEFINLVNSPPSNSFLSKEELNSPEAFFPLRLFVCDNCFLVQTDEYKKHEDIFNSNYAYYSSISASWLNHCENYVEDITSKLNLNSQSFVIEVASNDGYLLQYFKNKNIPCLGIEPTANTANVAKEKGIETLVDFFNPKTAQKINEQYSKADLIIGNNVIAHDPNLNSFVSSLKSILKPTGTITIEIPHLYQLITNNQFDTIYHEHFSYFSLYTHLKIYQKHNLDIYDVKEISTHGGSLRLFIKHKEDSSKQISNSINNILLKEKEINLDKINGYLNFQTKANTVKYDLLDFIINAKRNGSKIAGYGAAAKGNTLLNYCGIKNDLIDFIVDKSDFKQNKYTPGTHIPIKNEEFLKQEKPNYILILPWNIKEEIMEQLYYIKEWNGKFIVPVPELEII